MNGLWDWILVLGVLWWIWKERPDEAVTKWVRYWRKEGNREEGKNK